MRIPRSHRLTLAYVEQFGLPTVDFTMNNPEGYCHLFGRKHRFREVDAKPHLIGAHLRRARARHDLRRDVGARDAAVRRSHRQRSGDDGWGEVVAQYDTYSIREFLEEQGWSEAAIELFGLLMNQESLMNTSFLEMLREEVGRFYVDMVRIEGGMDLLPRAFLPALREPHPLRRAAGRARPGRRRRDRALPDRGRAACARTPTTRSSPSRSRCSATSR